MTPTAQDWASGPKEVIMYEEILKNYPPKVSPLH